MLLMGCMLLLMLLLLLVRMLLVLMLLRLCALLQLMEALCRRVAGPCELTGVEPRRWQVSFDQATQITHAVGLRPRWAPRTLKTERQQELSCCGSELSFSSSTWPGMKLQRYNGC